MNLARSMMGRIVGTCILCAVLGVAGAVFATFLNPQHPSELLAADGLRGLMNSEMGSTCGENPEKWRWTTPHNGKVGFYEREALLAQGPDVPDVDPKLIEALRSGKEMGHKIYFGEMGGGAYIADMGGAGPCSIYYARWPAMPAMRLGALG